VAQTKHIVTASPARARNTRCPPTWRSPGCTASLPSWRAARSARKIVEVAGATTEWTPEQVTRVAQLLRGASAEKRGPDAFIIDPERTAFPRA
jgi:hypothetical protein